jgi:choline dehydrogenase-like flavoprotein
MGELFDLVVVGGGLGGASLARSLAERGARVTIKRQTCAKCSELICFPIGYDSPVHSTKSRLVPICLSVYESSPPGRITGCTAM